MGKLSGLKGLMSEIKSDTKTLQEISITKKEKRGISPKKESTPKIPKDSPTSKKSSTPKEVKVSTTENLKPPEGLVKLLQIESPTTTKKAPRAKKVVEGEPIKVNGERRRRRTKAEMEAARAQETQKTEKNKRPQGMFPTEIIFDREIIRTSFEHRDEISIPSTAFDTPETRYKHRKDVLFDRVSDQGTVYVFIEDNKKEISVPAKGGIYAQDVK